MRRQPYSGGGHDFWRYVMSDGTRYMYSTQFWTVDREKSVPETADLIESNFLTTFSHSHCTFSLQTGKL